MKLYLVGSDVIRGHAMRSSGLIGRNDGSDFVPKNSDKTALLWLMDVEGLGNRLCESLLYLFFSILFPARLFN